MDDVDVIARAIVKQARADLYATAEQLRWGADRQVCVTCGAELQAGRCPWSKVGAEPAIDGRIYCAWVRAVRSPSPSYRYANRRK